MKKQTCVTADEKELIIALLNEARRIYDELGIEVVSI